MMSEMITSAVEDISVVDVYDLATNIGKECEKIIDVYGAETVTSLMPKVINALELLEALANRNECENSKMQKLTDRIAYLESEKQERAVFRERFQKVRLIDYKSMIYFPYCLVWLTCHQLQLYDATNYAANYLIVRPVGWMKCAARQKHVFDGPVVTLSWWTRLTHWKT